MINSHSLCYKVTLITLLSAFHIVHPSIISYQVYHIPLSRVIQFSVSCSGIWSLSERRGEYKKEEKNGGTNKEQEIRGRPKRQKGTGDRLIGLMALLLFSY